MLTMFLVGWWFSTEHKIFANYGMIWIKPQKALGEEKVTKRVERPFLPLFLVLWWLDQSTNKLNK